MPCGAKIYSQQAIPLEVQMRRAKLARRIRFLFTPNHY